jgi:hypothetical protein
VGAENLTYAELKSVVAVAFATARDIHRLDKWQSFEYAYEEMWSRLSSGNPVERLLAYAALMIAAQRKGVSFGSGDPSGEDVRDELEKIAQIKDSVLTQSVLGDELDDVSRDLAAVCAVYLS